MKKLLTIFLTMSIIITLGFSEGAYVYSNEYNTIIPSTIEMKLLYDYTYNDLDNLNKRIQVLAKNAISIKCEGNKAKINEYIKDIDAILNDINYLLSKAKSDYDTYKEDLQTSNGFLAVGIIASNYRLALTQLKEYLLSETAEDEYRTLGNYFKSIADAEKSTNNIKKYVPK